MDTSSAKIEFVRSNTLDYTSYGFCSFNQGAQVALPVSQFARTRTELFEKAPPDGLRSHLFTHQPPLKLAQVQSRLAESEMNRFCDTLLLSEEARSFALARAIAATNQPMLTLSNAIIDTLAMSFAYIASFAKSRVQKLGPTSRRRLYLMNAFFALAFCASLRFGTTRRMGEKSVDEKACRMGLDCAQGSIEFYDKLIERNKILREVYPNGRELIDERGELLKHEVTIPFTEFSFLIDSYYINGLSLEQRRDMCKREFAVVVSNMLHEENKKALISIPSLPKQSIDSEEPEEDKEWPVFKKIRLWLENSARSTAE